MEVINGRSVDIAAEQLLRWMSAAKFRQPIDRGLQKATPPETRFQYDVVYSLNSP